MSPMATMKEPQDTEKLINEKRVGEDSRMEGSTGQESDTTMTSSGTSLAAAKEFIIKEVAKLKWLTCCQMVLLVLSVLLVVLSVAMLTGCFHAIISCILHSRLEVVEGSEAYDMWKVTPIPMLLKMYLFNLTNPEQFKNGKKPILQECGPYVWREYHEKVNVTFNSNNTVSYLQQRWWVWDQQLSGKNTQDDLIFSLNTIPVSAVWAVRDEEIYLAVLNRMFNDLGEKLVISATVNELVFSGVKDPMLDWLQKEVVAKNGSYHFLLNIIGTNSAIVSFDKFAWFYKRNMSRDYDGLFNMKTGADSLTNLGMIDWWNKKHQTPFFSPPCNQVSGSAGEFFPPGSNNDHLVVFSSDLCMGMELFFKETTFSRGVYANRFWGTNQTFANGSIVPGKECYCVKGTCAPTGLLNAESCRMGAPAFISFPHFVNGDPFLLEGVTGLAPNLAKHAFILDIIPELGVPLRVAARLQINMHVLPYPGHKMMHFDRIDILRSVPDVYLPTLWFEVLAEMTPEMASKMSIVLYIIKSPITNVIIWWTLLTLALMVIMLVITLHYKRVGRRRI